MSVPPTIVEALRAHAAAAPERGALVAWDGGERRAWTYAELDAVTDRIAAGLAAAGLRPGARLALALANTHAGAFYRLLLGAYKAGVVPVPVNARLAPPETAHIVRDSGALRLVAPEAALAALAAQDLGRCATWPAEIAEELAAATGAVPDPPSHEDPADLLYTSGTTGLPKGAAFRHRSLAYSARALAAAMRLDAGDVLQTPAPVYTSTGTHTFPLPVIGAGATYVAEPAFDAERTAATLEAEGSTVFFGVPAMLVLLLERLAPERAFPSLRALMYGGSPMPEPTIARLLARFPRVGLWNLYGLTESGPSGCVLPPELAAGRWASVGRPVAGTDLRIVDAGGREQPPGEPGEIVMRGPTLMDGYHGLPEATRDALVDGWLHTGDVGRTDAGGFVYLVDRMKDLIVRGGFNVYPAEIEAVLHAHPDVLEAAVVAVPHRVLGEDACAVVVLRPGATAGQAELEAHCAERLADFKRPRRYVFLDALPRNTMGKVLKRELRAQLAGDEVAR